MASGLYVVTYKGLMSTTPKVVNLTLSTNKVILVTNTYTPVFDNDTHDAYADITGEVAAGGGYTQNSKTVGGTPTLTTDTGSLFKYTWSTSVDWTSSTITARGMVLTTAADGWLIVASDFGSDYVSTNGTFSITANASGIFTIDMA